MTEALGRCLIGTAVAALLIGGAADAKAPQEQVLAAFERGKTPSASTLIDCIQDAYRELSKGTFRNDVSFVAIVRREGWPDVTTIGTGVILQRGTDARFEASPSTTSSHPPLGDIPAFEGQTDTKFVFVRRGNEVRSLQENIQVAPGEFVSQAIKVDLSGFPPDVQQRVTGPFATLLEFDLLEAGSPLFVKLEIYQGSSVFTLSNLQEAPISPDDEVEFTSFFVQPETCLVVRMEQHNERVDLDQFIEFEADMAYTPGVRVPSSTFRLPFPPGVPVEDLTNNPEFLAAVEEQMEFDNEVLGPLD